jgi:ATP-binding cassette subfamily F protein 3
MVAVNLPALVQATFPDLNPGLLEYVVGIVSDAQPADFPTTDSLIDYFLPLFDAYQAESKLSTLCKRLHTVLGTKSLHDEDDQDQNGPRRLENGPVHMSSLAANTQGFVPGVHADITHAGAKRVATRVDERKLEKAELKLKAKMEKRKADVEVSFKLIDKPSGPKALTDAQISEILAARGRNNDVQLENFDLSHGSLRILTNATLGLITGRRYGLVGRNGIGKCKWPAVLVYFWTHEILSCDHNFAI